MTRYYLILVKTSSRAKRANLLVVWAANVVSGSNLEERGNRLVYSAYARGLLRPQRPRPFRTPEVHLSECAPVDAYVEIISKRG